MQTVEIGKVLLSRAPQVNATRHTSRQPRLFSSHTPASVSQVPARKPQPMVPVTRPLNSRNDRDDQKSRGRPSSYPTEPVQRDGFDSSQLNSKVQSKTLPHTTAPLVHGFAADQNVRYRDYMEDDHTVVTNIATVPNSLFAGLYDGHGGRKVVDFVKAQLHIVIERELRAGVSPLDAPLDALHRAFVKVDRMLLQFGTMTCGSTAAVCLCLPSARSIAGAPGMELHVANVGDTRAILIGTSPHRSARRLSVDHVATDPNEMARVVRSGGRVVNRRVGGSLAVSRAFGDHILKGEGGGVTAEPQCISHTLTGDERYLLMASDGVWDVMSDDDAQSLVLQHAESTPNAICALVVQSALAKGSRDNLSALLIQLPTAT